MQRGPAPVGYYVLAVVITLFVMLGLVMVLSASAQTEAQRGRSPYHIFNRQLMWAGLGAIGLIIAMRVSLTWLRRLVRTAARRRRSAGCWPRSCRASASR